MNVSRRELAVAVVAPMVAKLIENKTLPAPTGPVAVNFEDRIAVHDGFFIFAWPEFRAFMANTLGLSFDELEKASKDTVVCAGNCQGVEIHVAEEDVKVKAYYYETPDKFYATIYTCKKTGIEVYFDKDFVAFANRLGFVHDAYTIDFTLVIREGERPKIIQSYQIMEPRKEGLSGGFKTSVKNDWSDFPKVLPRDVE